MILSVREPVRANYNYQPLKTPEPLSASTNWGIQSRLLPVLLNTQITGWPRFMRNGFRLKPIPVHNGSGSYRFRSKTNSGSYWGPLGPGPSWPLWAPGPRGPWGPGPVAPFGPRAQGALGAPGPVGPFGPWAQGALGAHRLKHYASNLSP